MSLDLFYWTRITIYLIAYLAVVQFIIKPKKEDIKPAIFAGIIMSVSNFIVEASAKILGVWNYQSGGDFIYLLSIPINVLIHFVIGGYTFVLINEFIIKKFGSRYKKLHLTIIWLMVSCFISAVGDARYMIQDSAIYFQPWWTSFHVFWVWFFLYSLALFSFRFFKKKFPG